ncbi:hypothetical protein LguiA_028431 [Lonicera macranthoides]
MMSLQMCYLRTKFRNVIFEDIKALKLQSLCFLIHCHIQLHFNGIFSEIFVLLGSILSRFLIHCDLALASPLMYSSFELQ